MADLSVNFAGIKAPNPFWLASAPPTNSGYQIMKAFEAGWGGAVWKTLGVPVVNVSVVDLSLMMERDTTVEEVNQLLKEASEKSSVLKYNDIKFVSIDYNHNPASSIFDANQTRVLGRHIKVMAWYDNEWGFSNRMLDTTIALINAPE